MTWTRWVMGAVAGLTVALYMYGCGTSHPPGLNADTNNGHPVGSPCSPNGSTAICNIQTADHNGIIDCFHGTQTCQNGAWTACDGPGTVSSHAARLSLQAQSNAGLHILNFGPSPEGGPCSGNVCDPYCWGLDDDTGVLDEAGIVAGCYVQIDPGTAYNQLQGSWRLNPNPCTAGAMDNCNYGSHCSAGTCVYSTPGYTNPAETATDAGALPDFTLDVPCCGSGRNDGDCNGDDPPEFMVCNVGPGVGTGTVWVSFDDVPWAPNPGCGQAPMSAGHPVFWCSVDLTATPLNPGDCTNFTIGAANCTAGYTTIGTWGLTVNDPQAPGTPVPEGNNCNNYTAYDDDNSIGCGTNVSCTTAVYPKGRLGGLPGPKQGANANPCADNTECSYDYCCSNAGGTCNPWSVGPCMAACAGVDFTVGTGCVNKAGDPTFSVCNRGTTATTGGSLVLGLGGTGNPPTPPACAPPGYGSSCTIDLNVNVLGPGQCVPVDPVSPGPGITCACFGNCWNGNRIAYINDNPAIAECDTCNNWTEIGGGSGQCSSGRGVPVPPPTTVTFTYEGICPTGSHVSWNQFAYSVTTPVASSVEFYVQTAPATSDGGVGTWQPPSPLPGPVLIADPPLPDLTNPLLLDPQTCLMSGPNPCPINLNQLLTNASMIPPGYPGLTTNEFLLLTVTLTPISASPSADDWQITYDCVPSE